MARPADPHARSAVLAAARAEFVKHGLQKARIEDITHACGLSKGSFYLHFESKEAVFRELIAGLNDEFDKLRVDRERDYAAYASKLDDPDILQKMIDLGVKHDTNLLESLWTWRDVLDVLLRGCRGTEFEGTVWTLLDDQFTRVKEECALMQQRQLVRADVSGAALGAMVVGTYLMVARQLVLAQTKPDFGELVRSVGLVISQGLAPTPANQVTRSAT